MNESKVVITMLLVYNIETFLKDCSVKVWLCMLKHNIENEWEIMQIWKKKKNKAKKKGSWVFQREWGTEKHPHFKQSKRAMQKLGYLSISEPYSSFY